MTTKYPKIENADELLRELCLKGIDSKYDGELRRAALIRIEEELGYVKRQGSASGYLVTINALNAVGAKTKEFYFRGTFASSLLSYVTGLSDIEPLNAEPKLYPEFHYGVNGDKHPSFEMMVSEDLQNRLFAYFDHYPGKEPVYRFDSIPHVLSDLPGVYIGELEEEKTSWGTYIHAFSIIFAVVSDENKKRDILLSNEVVDVCHPETYEEYVKCYGFMQSTGAWKDNAEILLKEGIVPFSDLLAFREDVYEFLLNHGIDRESAYEITEYVRKGKASIHRRSVMLETINQINVPEWFKESCKKIKYLWPRAHVMILYKRYCSGLIESI